MEALMTVHSDSTILAISGDDLRDSLPANVTVRQVPVHNITRSDLNFFRGVVFRTGYILLPSHLSPAFGRLELLFANLRAERKYRYKKPYRHVFLLRIMGEKILRPLLHRGVDAARWFALLSWVLLAPVQTTAMMIRRRGGPRWSDHRSYIQGLKRWLHRGHWTCRPYLGDLSCILRYVWAYLAYTERDTRGEMLELKKGAKILIVIPDKIGDTITSLPMLESLATSKKDYIIDFLVSPAGAIILRGNPYVSQIHVIRNPHKELIGFTSGRFKSDDKDSLVLSRLRAGGYDCTINVSYWPERYRLVDAIRPKRSISSFTPRLLNYGTFRPHREQEWVYRRCADALFMIGEGVEVQRPKIWVEESLRKEVVERLTNDGARYKKRVGLVTDAPVASRRLPPVEVMNWVAKNEDLQNIKMVIFDKRDMRWSMANPEELDVIFIGEWPLEEAIAAVSSVDIIYGTEGGIGHIAAAFGVESNLVFTSFGSGKWSPPNSRRWQSRGLNCQPCFREYCLFSHECHESESWVMAEGDLLPDHSGRR